MVTTAKLIKVKKKWFTVVAPDVYKNTEVLDIAANEPQILMGRPVELSLAWLTRNPKDQQKKIILKITDVKGEKALTSPWRYFIQESFIQRAGKRYKEKFISVAKIKAKDGKAIKIKWLVCTTKKLHHPVRASLLRQIEKFSKENLPQSQSAELFDTELMEKLTQELRKELRLIYPIDRVLICKVSVLD